MNHDDYRYPILILTLLGIITTITLGFQVQKNNQKFEDKFNNLENKTNQQLQKLNKKNDRLYRKICKLKMQYQKNHHNLTNTVENGNSTDNSGLRNPFNFS